jgi:DNA-binding MarR family transcriptional regulator
MNDSDNIQMPAGGERSIFDLIGAAHALEARVETALERAQLSGAKFALLSALVDAGEPVSLSDLAARLSCVRSNMTQLVDRLEGDGLVRRVQCPGDRRVVKAELTELGRSRQAAGAAEVAKLHADFSASVSAEDRAAFHRLLTAMA